MTMNLKSVAFMLLALFVASCSNMQSEQEEKITASPKHVILVGFDGLSALRIKICLHSVN